MQFTTLVLGIATAAATTASAYQLPAHPTVMARAIAARGEDECQSAASTVMPLLAGYPTPPAAVESYLETASVTITDNCQDPVITGAVGSEFSTWATAFSSWRQDHVSEFRALWQACSDYPAVASALPTEGVCSSLVGQITSNPAMPRETGAIAAAALFAAGAAAAVL